MAGLHATSVKDFVMIFQVLVRKAHKTKRPSGSICEEKSWFSSEPTRSYLSGSAEVGERRIRDFNRKDDAQKINAYP